jgi:hypothetical protein
MCSVIKNVSKAVLIQIFMSDVIHCFTFKNKNFCVNNWVLQNSETQIKSDKHGGEKKKTYHNLCKPSKVHLQTQSNSTHPTLHQHDPNMYKHISLQHHHTPYLNVYSADIPLYISICTTSFHLVSLSIIYIPLCNLNIYFADTLPNFLCIR